MRAAVAEGTLASEMKSRHQNFVSLQVVVMQEKPVTKYTNRQLLHGFGRRSPWN